MKRLLLVLILLAAGFAQCSDIASKLETDYTPYLTTSVGCDIPHQTTLYANISQLAEGYSYVAQCFQEEGNAGKALAYYSLAGNRYAAAANALCSTDYALKMNLYLSSGDAYHSAGQDAEARASYGDAIKTYNAHTDAIDGTLYASANSRIYALDHPTVKNLSDVGDSNTLNWLPFVIAGIVFVGIGLTIVTLRK